MCAAEGPAPAPRGVAARSGCRKRRVSAAVQPSQSCLLALIIAISVLSGGCSAVSSPPHTPTAISHAPISPHHRSKSPSPSSVSSSAAVRRRPASALARIKQACPSVLSWDDFHRSDRSLHRDRLPTGQRYYASGPNQQLIRRNRYVSKAQPGVPDLLYVWLGHRPATLATKWVFTPGETSGQNAVIGVAPRQAVIGHRHLLGFGIGSVQLAVYPQYWMLFYITNANYSLHYHTVAMAGFKHGLRQDGRTIYQMAMTLHPANSSVTVRYPGGTGTYANPAFAALWGPLFGLQVRRPQSSDGNVQFLTAGSASAPCSAPALLGAPGHHH